MSSLEDKLTNAIGAIDGLRRTVEGKVETFVSKSGDQTIRGMKVFYSSRVNADDWQHSPISIRERNLAGPGADYTYAPNVNFHWAGRVSRSLYINNIGQLFWGEYDGSGKPIWVRVWTDLDIRVTSGRLTTTARWSAVGWWNGYDDRGHNYADVFPPAGYSMNHLAGFIASIGAVHYAGDVNGDDSIWCKWHRLGDRVRIVCNNSENRAASQVNYMAIWKR